MHEPFEWGRHDCVLWPADAVLALTGIDHAAPYRGRYSSPLGAARLLRRELGLEFPEHLFDRVLGERLPRALARLGDVVAADLDALGASDGEARALGLAHGICYGEHSLFVGTQGSAHGLVTLPTLKMEHCYRG